MPGTNNATIRAAIKRVESRERYAKARERVRNPRTSRIANRIRSRRRAA